MKYVCDQPPFDPAQSVDWAEIRGLFVHVSQNGYAYKSGPYPSEDAAEIAAFQLKYPD